MSYSNDLTQIRTGLVNYLGAAVMASPFESRAARHSIVSMMAEEALNLSKDGEEEPFDLYILKPMLRATIVICQQRINEMSKLEKHPDVLQAIAEYQLVCTTLTDILNKIK